MKAFFLALVFVSAAALASGAEISPISLRVEQVSKDQHNNFTHKQEKSLKVALTNSSAQDLNAVKIKYFYFARNVKTRDVIVSAKGEVSADVKSHATATFETPGVTMSYTEEHTEGNPFANKNGNNKTNGGMAKTKKVEASGKRFDGYGVQVFNGGALAGEYFSEPSLKAKAGN